MFVIGIVMMMMMMLKSKLAALVVAAMALPAVRCSPNGGVDVADNGGGGGVVGARDDADAWRAAESLSPLAASALGLIMGLHYEYWCTEFLPYMPTPAAYIETTATATVTVTVTATTTTTTTTTAAAVVQERGEQEAPLPAFLVPFGRSVVMEACRAVFRPGPRATTATATATVRGTVTVTETETATVG